MNLKQAEIILEKVTRLYKTMKIDERNIDVFEQDLMLSYIRQLYESFSPDKPVSKRIKPTLPPIEEIEEIIISKTPTKVEVPKPQPKPIEPKKEEKPKAIDNTPPRIIKPPVVEVKPTPEPTPAPKPTPVITPTAPKPEPVAETQTGLSTAERAALFEVREATDLSEKLSQAPIRDLTKAMGLNEKIFTINELFGGDSRAFDETLRALNNFNTYDGAKVYLGDGVAHTFNWTEKSRKKKAINFINLVKRRYN